MSTIKKRVDALERASGMSDKPWHVILIDEYQSHQSAFNEYREGKPGVVIESDHNIFWVVGVSPKFDREGNRIAPDAPERGDPPPLAELLAEAA